MRWSYFSYFMPAKLDRKLMEKGRRAEEVVEKKLSHLGLRRARNRELYFRNYTLVGRPDFVTRDFVVEVKSSVAQQYLLPNLAQLNLYMLMEGKKLGLLVFAGNGMDKMKIIYTSFSRSIIRQTIAYFDALWGYIREGVIPEIVFEVAQPVCRSCSFARLCGVKGYKRF
ncbi:hypothetical protein Arcve_1637 [Archaeoglobus veneficus SNP6]|uniref:CRISPR-associated exonuclease Cas4 n=2 Tax=Archaeoglobus veneficus TaxID=58290 RepID=F2KQ34_ARCVS|nr:hypothetical protein Arcve_1637 [Archaeoglobus veneficus SNP6]